MTRLRRLTCLALPVIALVIGVVQVTPVAAASPVPPLVRFTGVVSGASRGVVDLQFSLYPDAESEDTALAGDPGGDRRLRRPVQRSARCDTPRRIAGRPVC